MKNILNRIRKSLLLHLMVILFALNAGNDMHTVQAIHDNEKPVTPPAMKLITTQGPDHGQVGFQWNKVMHGLYYNLEVFIDQGNYLESYKSISGIKECMYVLYLPPGKYCAQVECVMETEKINGRMIEFIVESFTGWITEDEYQYYYIDNEPVVGMMEFTEGKRYFYEDYDEHGYYRRGGLKEEGWLEYEGKKYFISLGVVQTEKWVGTDYSHTPAYVLSNGEMAVGWHKIKGDYYYFDSKGIPCMGWYRVNGIWYYGDPENTGRMLENEWLVDGEETYYLDANGAMITGWLKRPEGWYYFGTDGGKEYGWIKSNGIWYYLDPANGGLMLENGVYSINGVSYGFSGSGAMYTYWQMIDEEWYYFSSDGAGVTGWIKSGGEWYYISSGNMLAYTVIEDKGEWYYLQKNGVLETTPGWIKDIGHNNVGWLYVKDTTGALHTGWKTIGGVDYYFLDDYYENMWPGEMLFSCEYQIDDYIYTFDESGACVSKVSVEE